MVEFPAEHIPAKVFPITLCINQMQVPCLIDFLRGRHWMTRFACEAEKTFVFADHTRRKHMTPSLFARQTAGEGKRHSRFIELEAFDALTQGG